MSKRNEPTIKVKDPKGEVFEVTRRNANDLVINLGWSYLSDVPEEDAALAVNASAPRAKGQSKSKVQLAREEAQAKRVVDPAATKAVGKKRGKKVTEEVVEEAVEAEKAAPEGDTFDETGAAADLDAELAALEAEEEERGKY